MILNINEFQEYLETLQITRKIKLIQNHHTYKPSYEDFNSSNHEKIQSGMKWWHTNQNGWDDIAQHITTFPDGKLMLGRSFDVDPIGIRGANTGAICVEHVGNFDNGNDLMSSEHSLCILKLNKILASKFNLPIDINHFVFHHWYDRTTGKRTGGLGNTKSCPGTDFYYGNSEESGELFLNLVIGMQV